MRKFQDKKLTAETKNYRRNKTARRQKMRCYLHQMWIMKNVRGELVNTRTDEMNKVYNCIWGSADL